MAKQRDQYPARPETQTDLERGDNDAEQGDITMGGLVTDREANTASGRGTGDGPGDPQSDTRSEAGIVGETNANQQTYAGRTGQVFKKADNRSDQ